MKTKRVCKKCGKHIPCRVTINGVIKVICGRRFCIECSPWGSNNRKDLTVSEEDRKERRKVQDNERSKRYYHRNPSKQRDKRRQRKRRLVAMFGGKCQRCGYDKCFSAMTFHHRDPKKKSFHFSGAGWLIKWERLLAEAKKCDLLCSNCHHEVHEAIRADGT